MKNFLSKRLHTFKCELLFRVTEQLCPFIYIDNWFYLFKVARRKDSLSVNCFITVHIVNMIKETSFEWCSNHKLCIALNCQNFHKKKVWLTMFTPYL